MDDKRLVKVSKYLSKHLRHEPERLGLELQPGGWVGVDELLAACAANRFPLSRAELEEVVERSDKKRFAFDETGTRDVATVAVLRSYASIAYHQAQTLLSAVLAEQALIQARIPFDLIFDEHLDFEYRHSPLACKFLSFLKQHCPISLSSMRRKNDEIGDVGIVHKR